MQKPIEKILEMLDGKEKLVLYGCGGCATIFHTDGEAEVKEMADTLSSHGKNILAAIALTLPTEACLTGLCYITFACYTSRSRIA